jgi:dihydrofolate synthase/folylpolyglutamate synthase
LAFDFAAWLKQAEQHGVKLGLERIRAALDACGAPQLSYPSILVGGTNGKGSAVTFAAELLRAGGDRVGVTISPHLTEYRERFRVDGRLATREELAALGERVHEAIAGRRELAELTFFELGTLMALCLFRDSAVDSAVLEVGMGGEFDAMRAAQSPVAAIVSVDLDHEEHLGRSVDEIARTKARIAPRGGILVTTERRADRLAVIAREVAEAGCTLRRGGYDFKWNLKDGRYHYEGPMIFLRDASLGMAGAHQADNAAAALAAVEALCAVRGLPAPEEGAVREALLRARIAGRLESVDLGGKSPRVLLDGAHNPAGARVLAQELSERDARRGRPRRRLWLWASMADKRWQDVARALLPCVDAVTCTRGTSSPRYEDPARMAAWLRDTRNGGYSPVSVREPSTEALRDCLAEMGPEDELLVAGSLYLVGDLRPALGLRVE